ncbi:integrase core domain-containing protein [Nonomuraea sp. NPDC003754]
MHGELATLGIKVAPSTIWEILKQEGIDPAPGRASVTWADLLRSQADALLACDFIETVTLNGQRQYILAVIAHATRRVRVLGTTAHPTAAWVIQAIKNLVMDLEDAGCRARYLIRDRDGKFPALMEEILTDAGIHTVLTGVRMPRMNSVMERWVQSCRRELLDRCLLWNEHHLRHALREYEHFYNQHRAHQALAQAAPLRAVPDPITDPERIIDLNVRRRDRLGGVLHEYSYAA